jgi:hypothetical protein
MKNIFVPILSLSILLMLLSSCATTKYGTHRTGNIAIVEDTAKLEKTTTLTRAYKVSYKTLNRLGVITLENKSTGMIEAEVINSKVTVWIEPILPNLIRIKITARKDFNRIPNPELALEIINNIKNRV